MRRSVFFVSDSTGITAETLGETLLTQFPKLPVERATIPFVNTVEKAHEAVRRLRAAAAADGADPVVFSTLTAPDVLAILATGSRHVFDLFGTYIEPLEKALGTDSSHTSGVMHGMQDHGRYQRRVDALNYTLDHDDGLRPREMNLADIILVGVSRSGKTPTCLYMAMHFHLKCANYPLNDDDLEYGRLPPALHAARQRLYGLTITPEQLSRIRHGRRPGSRYASLEQCRSEVERAELLFREEGIPCIDTTSVSIEEIATTIQQHFRFARPHH